MKAPKRVACKPACSYKVPAWDPKLCRVVTRQCQMPLGKVPVIHKGRLFCRHHSPVRDVAAERLQRYGPDKVGYGVQWRA